MCEYCGSYNCLYCFAFGVKYCINVCFWGVGVDICVYIYISIWAALPAEALTDFVYF